MLEILIGQTQPEIKRQNINLKGQPLKKQSRVWKNREYPEGYMENEHRFFVETKSAIVHKVLTVVSTTMKVLTLFFFE